MLKPKSSQEIPEETKAVAKEVFPKGNVYLTLRDELGTIFVICSLNSIQV
jgi:transposase